MRADLDGAPDEHQAHRQPLLLAPRAGLVALAVCMAVRGLLYLTGTRFSAAYLTYGWQLVPAEVLRRHPFSSVWYLHIQPPLFNLMTGVLLRWSPFPTGITFQLVFLAMAGLLIVVSHDVFVRLGASPLAATLITVFVFCDPDWIRYELTPQYEVPVALLVVLAVWSLLRLAPRPTLGRWMVFVGIVTAVVLTRSLFHPLWLFVVLLVVVWWLRGRGRRRDVVLAAAVPVLLVGGWMVKNEAVFGHATMSSWFGMNLQRAVISPLTPAQLDQLTADGTVSGAGHRRTVQLLRPVHPVHRAMPADRRPRCDDRPREGKRRGELQLRVLPADLRPAVGRRTRRHPGRARPLPVRPLVGAAEHVQPSGRARAGPIGVPRPGRPLPGPHAHRALSTVDERLGATPVPAAVPRHPVQLHPGHLLPVVAVRGRPRRAGAWPVGGPVRPGWPASSPRSPSSGWSTVGSLFEIGENFRFRIMVQPLLVGLPLVALAGALVRRRQETTP